MQGNEVSITSKSIFNNFMVVILFSLFTCGLFIDFFIVNTRVIISLFLQDGYCPNINLLHWQFSGLDYI